ncbi:MAG TPA: hypothetical protein VE596_08525 [Gaiellaceae bacterium]|nr:hypothetical protein [Gaiellaceae bacterium]
MLTSCGATDSRQGETLATSLRIARQLAFEPLRSISQRLAVLLAILSVGTTVVWFAFRSHTWANDWLPNFIAEWTGLFLAVFVIDRLLERERERHHEYQRELRRRPMREAAGQAIERALAYIISFAVSTYAQLHEVVEEEAVDAWEFLQRWIGEAPTATWTEDPEAVTRFALALTEMRERLLNVPERYQDGLDGAERVRIFDLQDLLRPTVVQSWAESMRSSRRGETVRSLLANQCRRIGEAIEPVLEDYSRMRGSRLTTEVGWAAIGVRSVLTPDEGSGATS